MRRALELGVVEVLALQAVDLVGPDARESRQEDRTRWLFVIDDRRTGREEIARADDLRLIVTQHTRSPGGKSQVS
jgi:hypothetical protein